MVQITAKCLSTNNCSAYFFIMRDDYVFYIKSCNRFPLLYLYWHVNRSAVQYKQTNQKGILKGGFGGGGSSKINKSLFVLNKRNAALSRGNIEKL